MNINNLQVQLQTAVENAATEASTDNTSATLYYLQLAKAVNALNMGQIRTVANIASLPTASTHEGWLFFVQDVELLYFSNGTAWDGVVPVPVPVNTIYSWALNSSGELGDNTIVNKSSPVSVVGGFTDWCQISAGQNFSLAVRQNSTAWAWGNNGGGQLGDNSTVSKSSPVSVVGGFTDWSQVSAGYGSSLAIRQNGTLWGWGGNSRGQLGDNTAAGKLSPVSVVGGFTDWCQVETRNSVSVAVRQNGTAWAWGCGSSGRLGDNTTVNKSSPVSVVGGFCDWCQISAGNTFSLAVRQNGSAWGWGCNNLGQLGDGTVACKSSPVSVVGGFTDWCQIDAGQIFSLALRQNGTAWGWGTGGQGQLGIGASTSHSSPVSVVGGFTDWCQISAGQNFSLAVRQNSTAWAWGEGTNGQLGNDATTIHNSPVSVVGGFTDWSQISAGIGFSLGLRSTL